MLVNVYDWSSRMISSPPWRGKCCAWWQSLRTKRPVVHSAASPVIEKSSGIPCWWMLVMGYHHPQLVHWPIQEPKLEVPTIYKAYFSGLCKEISPQNMAFYGTVPPFLGSWNSHWLVDGHTNITCFKASELWYDYNPANYLYAITNNHYKPTLWCESLWTDSLSEIYGILCFSKYELRWILGQMGWGLRFEETCHCRKKSPVWVGYPDNLCQ